MNRHVLNFLMCMFALISTSNLQGVWEQPPHDLGEFIFSQTAVASDASGNAVFIAVDRTLISGDVVAYNYFSSTNTWSSPTLLEADIGDTVDVAMDNSGTAIAIWSNNLGEVRTAFWDGSTWTVFPDPLETAGGGEPNVSMNGPSSALAAWVDGSTNVRSSFFEGGVFSTPTTIGTGFGLSIAYSSNGTAVAGFFTTDPLAANYIGGAWQAPVTLNAGQASDTIQVGIDANGNALAAWRDDSTSNILSSFFNGSSWQAPIILGSNVDTLAGPEGPALVMAPTGTAVVAWTTGLDPSPGYSRAFDGASFGPVINLPQTLPSMWAGAIDSH